MTTHNTGNPVPSAAVKDLYDNAENLDKGINGDAPTWVDRKGQVRKSMAGVEQDFQKFLADGSTIEFPTWAAASAAAGAGQIPLNRQVAVIGDGGSHTDPVSGLTVSNSGRYVMVAAGLEWRSADVVSQKADRSELELKLAVPVFSSYSDSVSQALASGEVEPISARVASGVYGLQLGFANLSAAFDAGADMPVGSYFDSISAPIVVGAGTTRVRVLLWTQGIAEAGGSGLGPGSAGDVLLEDRTAAVADLGITPGSTSPTEILFPLSYREVESGTSYLIELDAVNDSGQRQVMGIRNLSATDWMQWRRGYYRNSISSNFWSNVSSPAALAINLGRSKFISIPNLSGDVQENAAKIEGIAAAFSASQRVVSAKPATADFGLSDDAGWAAMIKPGIDVDEGVLLSGLLIPRARLAAGAVRVVLNIRTRSAGGNEALVPGVDPSDVLVFSRSYTLAELETAADGVARDMKFLFPTDYRVTDRNIIFDWVAYSASDAVMVSTQGYRASGSDSAGRRGWYKTTPSAGFGPINSSFSVCWSVLSSVLVVKPEALPNSSGQSSVDQVTSAEFAVTDLKLSVRARLLRGSTEYPIAASLTIAAATTGSVASEARTLATALNNYVAFAYAPAVGRLSNANVSDLVVSRVSDGAILSPVSDYQVNGPLGAVMRANAGVDVPVTVSYSWANSRYSLVYLDANTLQLGVIDGVEKARFASEFAPERGSSSRIPLAYVRVVGGAMSVHPVWAVRSDYVHRDVADQWEADRVRNARSMRSTLGALRSGKPVVGIFYGDSIVAMQNAVPPVSSPNGAARDRATSSGGYISIPPLTDAIPVYDFGDGAGQVHTKWGYARAMVAEMERAYGRAISVQNLGLGGSRSDSSATNGLDPARLAALTGLIQAAVSAGSQAFVLINFGMNEVGVATTEANVRQILDAIYAAGGDAIVAGVARRNLIDVGYTDDQWRFTNRALRQAAEYVSPATGKMAGFIDTVCLFDDAYNVLGLHRLDNCSANFTNHPGIREHGAMAKSATAWLD